MDSAPGGALDLQSEEEAGNSQILAPDQRFPNRKQIFPATQDSFAEEIILNSGKEKS